MDDFLKAYGLEVLQLRRLSCKFARWYPKAAGKLQMEGDFCEDPRVERLIQAVTLIAARISKRLDDDYLQFTEGLLDVFHAHYLRPFSSCVSSGRGRAVRGATGLSHRLRQLHGFGPGAKTH